MNGAATIPFVQLVRRFVKARHAFEVEMAEVDAAIPEDPSNIRLGVSGEAETLLLGDAERRRSRANRKHAGTASGLLTW
jgi:hypothetical protein